MAPEAAETPRGETPLVPREFERFAPRPRLRVALQTRAQAVRLTSSRPFRVGSPGRFVETQDVLVEPAPSSVVVEGDVYRLQLGSFPVREAALQLGSALREEVKEEPVVERELQSGRFVVRLGAFTTEGGARARLAELEPFGLEGVSIVREPSKTPRPLELLLRPSGQPVVRTPSLVLQALPGAPGAFIEVDNRPYRGYIEIFVNRSNLFTIVNVVNLEDYLKGVVPKELSPKAFPEKEALKAQALAARTYAEKRRGQFAAEGYDICATPACQVYRGVAAEQPMATEAVLETEAQVLTYDGELVDALYTSTCGGRTENAENIFSSPKPYLVSRACFLESRESVVRANAGPRSLASAALTVVGIAAGGDIENERPASSRQARLLMKRAVDYLGQTPCFRSESDADSPLDLAGLAEILAEGLCWERRLQFLFSPLDARRLVPTPGLSKTERLNLAYAVQDNLVRPPDDGIRVGAPVSRREVVETMYRLVRARGKTPLRQGRILRIEGSRLFLRDDSLGDDDNEIATSLAPSRFLFVSRDERSFYAKRLTLLAGDRVSFHLGDQGIDLLALRSEGGSFDRSSKFSHWVVRKSNEDLSREIAARYAIGKVLDLRPKRYGRSGRIVELEIVGTEGSTDLKGLAVRRALGIRENLFFLDAQRSAAGEVDAWVFTGRGWGHGVGMCQVGAFGMAAAGYSYREILAHYYPGTRILELGDSEKAVDVDMAPRAP